MATKKKSVKVKRKKAGKITKPKKKRLTAQEQRDKRRWDDEMFEREARQRTAWAHYGAQMSYQRAVEEDTELKKAKYWGDDKKVQEIEEKRKNRSSILRIY